MAATKKLSITRLVLLAAVVVFFGIQFIPVDRSNPAVVQEPNWDSPKTRDFARRACFDCHSNEVNYPWYSYVAPVSWFLAEHIKDGRDELNLSDWKPGDGVEAAKKVRKGKMPLKSYLLMHPEARLTDSEKKEFIAGLAATFGGEK